MFVELILVLWCIRISLKYHTASWVTRKLAIDGGRIDGGQNQENVTSIITFWLAFLYFIVFLTFSVFYRLIWCHILTTLVLVKRRLDSSGVVFRPCLTLSEVCTLHLYLTGHFWDHLNHFITLFIVFTFQMPYSKLLLHADRAWNGLQKSTRKIQTLSIVKRNDTWPC